jgi:hypothetical protein
VKRLLSLTCALTVSGCTPRSDDLVVDPARECQTAAQLYASSEHGGPYMSRTLWRVHECPQEAGRIVAELLTATRLERDTAVVQRQTSLAQYVHAVITIPSRRTISEMRRSMWRHFRPTPNSGADNPAPSSAAGRRDQHDELRPNESW